MKVNIKTASGISVCIRKEKTDPMCLRASIGGSDKLGYYLIFRGDEMLEIENMLEETLAAFRKARVTYSQQSN